MKKIYLISQWSTPTSDYPHDNGFRVEKKYLYFRWDISKFCTPLYLSSGMGSHKDKRISIERI